MHELFHSFVKLNLFIPHGHCYLWKPELVGLHLISDVTIALAYYSIPITLLYFVRQRRDLPFYGIFLLFSAFIISCGTTHLMEVWTLWHPIYWVSGALKAITALVSLYTAFILASLIPEALALPSLATTNQKLEAEIAERQKTEIALRESEEKFRSIFEQAAVGMCLVSPNGQFIRTNPKLSEILGYSQPELLNLKFKDVTHPEDLAIDLEQVQKLLTGEMQTFLREKRYIRKDGAIVQANLTVSLLRDAAGNPQQFISVIQDITDRKRAEAALQDSESRFQAFMNNSPTASWITDENGRLIYISETYKQVFQIPEDYIPQKTDRQLYSPELAQQYLQNIRKVVQTRQVVEAIELAPRRDGTIGQFLVYKFPLQSLSKQLLVGGVAIDITDRVRAEQALQQLNQELEARVAQRTAALQASEERFRNLVETSSDWVWEINEHNVYTYVSPKVFDILGYQPDEIIGKTPFELMPKEEAEKVAAELRKYKDARQPIHCIENTNLHRCGNSVVLETSGVPFFDPQGNFQGYRGIDRDITRRKQVEAELLAVTNLQQAILDGTDYAIISNNIDGIIQTFNSAAQKMLGYTAEEVVGQITPAIFHDPEELKQRAEALSLELGKKIAPGREFFATKAQNGTYDDEWTYIRKDGSRFPVLLSIKFLEDSQGKTIGFLGIAKDITQQKQIEAKLRQNAVHLATAQRIAHLGSWETDLQTQEIVWSEEVFRIFGREPASGPPSYKEFRQSVHPDDLDRHDALLQQTIEQGQPYEYEYRLLHPDGKLRYLLARAEAILDPNGKSVRVVGTVLDLTDRKLAEEQLRNLSDRLTLAVKSGAIGIWEWDIVRNLGIWDDRMYELYGLERCEPDKVCQQWLNRLHPDDRAQVEASLALALHGKKEYDIEFRVIHTDGKVRYLKGYALVQRNERGEPQRMVGINYDITERQQNEEQLRNLSVRLTLALKSRAIGIWDWDMVREAEWDDRMYELYGWSKSDRVATYKDWLDAVHPDSRAAADANLQDAVRVKKEYDTEFRIIRPDGSIRYIKARAVIQRNERGEPQRMVGINYDITDRKLAEEALRESERRYASLAEAAPVAIFRFDTDGNCIYVNDRWSEMMGRPTEAALGIGWVDILHPEDRDRIPMKLAQWLQTSAPGETYRDEGRTVRSDGTIIWFYCQIIPETNSNGIPIGYIGTLTDITDRKLAEQQLQESRMMLQLVLDTIPQRVFWKDRQFRYLGCNRTFAEDGQITIEEILGKTDFELPWAKWAHLYRADDTKVIDTGTPKLGYEEPTEFTNGKSLWIRTNKVPLTNSAGEVIGVLGSYEDITDRKLAEEKLRHTNEELMLANVELARATRLKDEFLANMSHELRTPLNVILGMAEGLQDSVFGEMGERQKKSLATIESSGRHLLELINDILDLSKIEAGKLELEISDVSIKELCEASVVFVKHLAFQKGIHFHTNIPENLGSIEADDRRLRQALINLLSNAVKFTPEGGSVTLEVRLENAIETPELEETITSSIPKSSYHLCFAIIDTGIGIAPENLGKLFQAFVQIDSSLSRRYSGTGLGLALVKQIANLHGGTVSVSSEVGRGSCFTIRIPYLGSSHSDRMEVDRKLYGAIASSVSTLESPLILLVDDNQPTSDTVSSYLKSRGYRLIVANNGQQALNLAQTQQPNLILMDIQMPEMDGLEAIRQIRAQGQTDIAIIALTALAMSGDRQKCLQAGADEYLTKPIQLQRLSLIIQQILSKDNKNL
ncbi:PAS domain S-box protein [Planktothrix sp. FACHB-1355]|uniref:Circadian input-output histidine kinase CikA n=1 Tax=Aerosakkonema funiforme FACHB-1375 TaxID=2949571 RepID=A0A926VAB7_9CYAN|nr:MULTISPECIES: PAS domain S-box protein [Oscillatoriales]MBD2180010.1 PAS domain S-box protein [Aerosakkonema funiforme FACHB-1375]MBD3559135.1 PAS domain S-box protein [Planktothrix sp. FACHB-1355]